VLALDFDDLIPALRLAATGPWFGTMKVGLELSTAGPEAITAPRRHGCGRLRRPQAARHPQHGRRAAGSSRLGAATSRCTRGRQRHGPRRGRGPARGAAGAELPRQCPSASTILTSEPDTSSHVLRHRVTIGLEGGCTGFVCAHAPTSPRSAPWPRALLATPRHPPRRRPRRRPGPGGHPRQAVEAGADLSSSAAPSRAADPTAAARDLVASLA
jgi:hypothetical protein